MFARVPVRGLMIQEEPSVGTEEGLQGQGQERGAITVQILNQNATFGSCFKLRLSSRTVQFTFSKSTVQQFFIYGVQQK